ncbi:MAG: TetR/AcrR family transcriptional regulator [Pseudomonadota bacterium]
MSNQLASDADTPRRQARRTAILEQALRLFSERGLGSAGMKEIADALGLTHAALYYYFPSREALVVASVSHAMQGLIDALNRAQADSTPDPALRLAELVRAQVRFELGAVGAAPFVNAFLYGPLAHGSALAPEEREAMRDLQRQVVDAYRGTVLAGARAGVFHAPNPTIAAFNVMGMVSYTVSWFRPEGALGVAEIADQVALQAVRSVSHYANPA